MCSPMPTFTPGLQEILDVEQVMDEYSGLDLTDANVEQVCGLAPVLS